MARRVFSLPMVLAVLGLLNAAAFALPPIGPPGSVLSKGQWAFDLVYGYSDMDLDADGKSTVYWAEPLTEDDEPIGDEVEFGNSEKLKVEIKNLKSNMIFSSIGYGIAKNLDAYVRLGGIDAEFDMDLGGSFEGNWGFSYGVGTRATFTQEGKLSIGGLCQFTWGNSSADMTMESDYEFEAISPITYDPITGNEHATAQGCGELSWYEIELAIGATYQMDGWCVYGGPFFYWFNGDLDFNSSEEIVRSWQEGPEESPTKYAASEIIRSTCSLDVEQGSEFGGFVGAKWDCDKRSLMYVEGQFTGAGWGVFIGGIFGVP